MKLSEKTLTVLKNFSAINSSLVLQQGKVQKTISPEQTVLVEARLEDDFPEQFGIYDLSQFLGNVNMLKNPDMTFNDKFLTMDDGEMQLSYYACSPSLIKSPPVGKDLVLKKIDVAFDVSETTLTKILNLARLNNLSNISVVGKNGELRLQSHEKSNDTSNFVSTRLDAYNGDDFTVSFKTENLRMIPGSYHVEIMIDGFSKWVSANGDLTYFIAVETK